MTSLVVISELVSFFALAKADQVDVVVVVVVQLELVSLYCWGQEFNFKVAFVCLCRSLAAGQGETSLAEWPFHLIESNTQSLVSSLARLVVAVWCVCRLFASSSSPRPLRAPKAGKQTMRRAKCDILRAHNSILGRKSEQQRQQPASLADKLTSLVPLLAYNTTLIALTELN